MANPLQTLRHHVTGSIERGETVAIEGKPMAKQTIIDALNAWVSQRPGLDYRNYGDPVAYRAEMRSIGRDLQHARAMVNYVAWHDSITAEMILHAAGSGRLTLTADGDKVTINYVTGQYWPTEYRRAVCSLMATVIWRWISANASTLDIAKMPQHGCMAGIVNQGDYIRKTARRELGQSIARRWFE